MKGPTDFAAMTETRKVVWSRETWSAARDQMFVKRFLGSGPNSMIQRITELTKTEKGDQAIWYLVADLVEDGVAGDNEREGHEEMMAAYEQIIGIGLLSHQVKNKGKLADQKTVLNQRKMAREKLAYWLADRVDQMAFLMLAGISFAYKNNGAPRLSNTLASLDFAADVRAPTSKRHLRWDATNGLVPGDTTAVTSSDVITYNAIVDMTTYAKDHYIKPLRANGKDYYCALVKPGTLGQLRKDPDYQRAITTAYPRSAKHPWFTGATVTVDGLVFHEHRNVYSTHGAASGSKWGADGTVNGTRTTICGAQAMGMIDFGPGSWEEEKFQYKSRWGISIDKMFGMLVPEFFSIYDNSVETFGALSVDHYLQSG